MEASLAYTAKKPILSDEEYDSLKAQLREQSSKVVKQVGAFSEAVGHFCMLAMALTSRACAGATV